MLFSDTVGSYLPLVSLEEATNKYKVYCEQNNITTEFIDDLAHRKVIQSRYFANSLYIHPLMFENWLTKHKNKQGRPFQNEGYLNTVDVRKYLEETDQYKYIGEKDVKILFENNLLGKVIYCEKNTPYVLKSEVESFCEKDKLFCHNDIVNMVEKYIKKNFGTIYSGLSKVIGFDINNIGSLIYRGYLKADYYSDTKTNNAYFVAEKKAQNCMIKLEALIQKNAKIKRQEKIVDNFHFSLTSALEHKALLVNKLKPFNPPSKTQRWKYRKSIQEKFETIERVKTFLSNEIELFDISTDLDELIVELKSIIPYSYKHNIYINMSKMHIKKVNVPFDRQLEMYEEAVLDESNIF